MSVLSVDKNLVPFQQDMAFKPLAEENSTGKDINFQGQASGDVFEQQLEEAIGQINNTVRIYRTELKFTIHKESGRISVKVIDQRDNSVIREIPTERALKFAAHVKKMLGVIFDEFI